MAIHRVHLALSKNPFALYIKHVVAISFPPLMDYNKHGLLCEPRGLTNNCHESQLGNLIIHFDLSLIGLSRNPLTHTSVSLAFRSLCSDDPETKMDVS